MVEHDYNRRVNDQAKQMIERGGKGWLYLILAIGIANALFIMPAFYILN